jgi:hypothetical protein
MYSQGRIFDVCGEEHGHEPPHHAPNRGFTFADNGALIAYDKPMNPPQPALDAPTAPESPPGTMLPEPGPGTRESAA